MKAFSSVLMGLGLLAGTIICGWFSAMMPSIFLGVLTVALYVLLYLSLSEIFDILKK